MIKLKDLQFKIIQKYNMAIDEYHTCIRDVKDIKTFNETLNDSSFKDWKTAGFDPSYSAGLVLDALKNGSIVVYSSYPIKVGNFVTPSKMEAIDYAGQGKVYCKRVKLTDIAWIDPTQGMYVGGQYDNT